MEEVDRAFMQRALDLATQATLRMTTPNPRVGCVIVHAGRVIGEGFHVKCGEAHAEVNAIADAEKRFGSVPEGATFYVTLEPCAHHGRTPPCVETLLRLKPARVVVGSLDTNPRVAIHSRERLEKAGVEVVIGVEGRACEELNAGFLYWMHTGRPWITAKVAVSQNWKSAALGGHPRLQLTGEMAQRWVHRQRQQYDAVSVGAATLLADQPQLDARLGLRGLGAAPDLVVWDTHLKLPLEGSFWNVPERKIIVVTTLEAPRARFPEVEARGAWLVPVKSKNGHVDIEDGLRHLAKMNIRSLWMEPGPTLLASFLPWIQRLFVIQSPALVESGARDWLAHRSHAFAGIEDRRRWCQRLGSDELWQLL